MEYSGNVPDLFQWISPIPSRRIRLQKGRHHFYLSTKDEYVRELSPLVSVDSVTYGDLDGDGKEEAAVWITFHTGGTQNWDFLYVYKLYGARPKLLGILESGSRGYGGLGRCAISNGLLVLNFNDPDRREGDCCSEGYIRIHFRWENGAFVEAGPREHGNWNSESP